MIRVCRTNLSWGSVLLFGRFSVGTVLLGTLFLAGAVTSNSLSAQAGKNDFLNIEKYRIEGRNYYRPVKDDPLTDYSTSRFLEHIKSIPLEVAAVYGSVAAIGIAHWSWLDSGFCFKSEGWFGKNTIHGGMDKLGHAFSSALISDLLTDRIRMTSRNPGNAALTGAFLSAGIMSMIEVFDGFASDYGFSSEDLTADGIGIAFSYLRNTIPGLREKIDFRQEFFMPKYEKDFNFLFGYESKRFILALKLSGFEAFRDTPLRFVEIHAGYYARGFSKQARRAGIRKRREPYIGIGINLNELFLGQARADESILKWGARFTLEHFQAPFTSFGTGNSFYKGR